MDNPTDGYPDKRSQRSKTKGGTKQNKNKKRQKEIFAQKLKWLPYMINLQIFMINLPKLFNLHLEIQST